MKRIIMVALVMGLLPGCATYRVTSNIVPNPDTQIRTEGPVMLLETDTSRPYSELGPIEVTVLKGNPFMASPTRKEADRALAQKAREQGADAVIRIHYESGFDVVTWGHIKANGVSIRFSE